ncbi:helix-turn-helix transcriptional regulator [Brevundimonas vesicularis]|uniref:helix-turn-helix domain-containing protein n=1 Tax=Brevundimonas vesicularis TaxID=41276 RepID=UPI001C2D3816|nr:helix-turn-helix transcriptional regulator [Brevundimonas vesicularis]
MSVRRHSMSLNLDRLTAQEQDLLRLLAQGHTAKTIANLTGLSVNSVNERLRSARRKTGAVSSRELARRLADQAPQPPQEIQPKLFGIGRQTPKRHWSGSDRAATGKVSLWKTAMAFGAIFAAALAGLVTSRFQYPAASSSGAISPLGRAAHSSGGEEWRGFFRPNVPAVAFLVPNPSKPYSATPQIMLVCEGLSMTAIVRGFSPHDAWPQPEMDLRVGDVVRTGSPRVKGEADDPALEYAFSIADEILEPLAQGAPIAFTFDGQTISAPTISEPWRSRFVKACGDLVHPGMRRRGAVSARVY